MQSKQRAFVLYTRKIACRSNHWLSGIHRSAAAVWCASFSEEEIKATLAAMDKLEPRRESAMQGLRGYVALVTRLIHSEESAQIILRGTPPRASSWPARGLGHIGWLPAPRAEADWDEPRARYSRIRKVAPALDPRHASSSSLRAEYDRPCSNAGRPRAGLA